MTWAGRHRIPVLLAAATLVPVAVLGWLGVRLLQQDRDIERQRQRERLEVIAGRLALDMERWLQNVEEGLDRGAGGTAALVRFSPAGFDAAREVPLLYQPLSPTPAILPAAFLAAAEVEEFQRRDLSAAAATYRRLAESHDAVARAAALVGLGRVLRRSGDRPGALAAYADLERLGPVVAAGQPAGLVGGQGRCKVLEDARDAEGLRAASEDLAHALNAGRFAIDRATFDMYREMLGRWGAPAPAPDVLAKTDAAIELWRLWRGGALSARGRRVVRLRSGPVLAVWGGETDRPAVWLSTSSELEAALRPLWLAQHLAVSVSDLDGQPVFSTLPAGATTGGVSLTPGETRLPFILSVASLAEVGDGGALTRRMVLITGLLVALLLMLAAAYGLYRTTTRELRLVRQQSEFVSAVSHEFRTPLTSMRHLTDLLVSRGHVTSDERKGQYYKLLARETERLHRMVEALLSFGRIEEGAYAWQLERADAALLVRETVEDFRREPLAGGREIRCEVEAGLPAIHADREALARALWNLLENAAKYSDPGTPIHVFAKCQGAHVLVGVSDTGAGIPAGEHQRIFHKFVRGSGAAHAGIRGVGIGLALVRRIAEAHGGSVQLSSAPGRGSTFTLVLPCLAF